jgi:hypothetical protein
MRNTIKALLAAFGLLGVITTAGVSTALPNATYPLISDPGDIGIGYSSVCTALRLNNGVCYWWLHSTSASQAGPLNSDTFRILKRTKVCMDTVSSTTSGAVQIFEWVTPSSSSPVYSISPVAAVLDGTDCVWLARGEYWFEGTPSTVDKLVVSLREVPEQ